MNWLWDENKNTSNKQKHGISFETAQFVFFDPLSVSHLDTYPHEERWHTIGKIGNVHVLVVHSFSDENNNKEQAGRIISARKATKQERKIYEEKDF